MEDPLDTPIIVDEEAYESKAIRAYIEGRMSAKDLQASLDLSRATTFRLIKRFKENGSDGLTSRKYGTSKNAYSKDDRERILGIVRGNYSDFGPKLASEKLDEIHGADRHSIFRTTRPDANGNRSPTQFSCTCQNLNIQIICANTPQAKGRVEEQTAGPGRRASATPKHRLKYSPNIHSYQKGFQGSHAQLQ